MMIIKTDSTLPDPPISLRSAPIRWTLTGALIGGSPSLRVSWDEQASAGRKEGSLGRIDTYLGRSSRAEDSRGLWREAELAIRPPLAARSNI